MGRADVVVIGAGAAGAAMTWRLSERGLRVVCLEQGDWINPRDYPSMRRDYETEFLRGSFNADPNVRGRPEDYPVVSDGPPTVEMFNAVGGSTIQWLGVFFRLRPSDFRVRSLDGVAEDWPISYRDLEPYYELNDAMMGVSGLNGDPANPPRTPRPMPPLPIGKVGEIMAGGFDQLGWHWWPTENAINSRVYDGRAGCVLHGKCMFGCPLGAKSSTDVTYWPKALANGAELITRARAQEISVDRRGRARGVVYFDREGRLQEQQASVVVVCCNGVGTPRLLLNSKSSLFPDGLANSSGNVGKYLMMHPYRFVDGLMAERTDGHLGAMGGVIFSQQFYETDYARGFARGYTLLVDRTFGPLTHALWGDVPWGRDHHVTMRRHFPHTIGMTVMSDDLPEERNRVELDGEVTDSNGIPAPRVIYRVGDNTEAMLQHGAERTHQVLEAAGAAKILDGGVPWFGSHLLGTARMGSDPLISVVNAWNQAHDVPNLFVVDGSSFTTSGGVNPTATIGALALRAADGIWDRRGEWP